MVSWTLVVHVFGFFFWIAGLLGAAIVQGRRAKALSGETRDALAGLEKAFLRGMADPGALIAMIAGIVLISSNSSYYLHARWLHIKLTFVASLLVLHVVVAMRSRRGVSASTLPAQRGGWLLVGGIVLVFFLILMATLPGEVFLN